MENKTRNDKMEGKKNIKEIAASLRTWTESQGKKPRQWAKIPVGTLNALCSAMEEARDEDVAKAYELARGWQADAARVRKLLGRLSPYMDTVKDLLKRSVDTARKQVLSPGYVAVLAEAENRLQEFSTLVGEAKAEARRGEE